MFTASKSHCVLDNCSVLLNMIEMNIFTVETILSCQKWLKAIEELKWVYPLPLQMFFCGHKIALDIWLFFHLKKGTGPSLKYLLCCILFSV